MGRWVDSSGSRSGQVAGSFEHGNEPSVSVICIIVWLRNLDFEGGLCSMELILCSESETVDNLQYPRMCVSLLCRFKVLAAIHVYHSLVEIAPC
jgi:hypothetical protein